MTTVPRVFRCLLFIMTLSGIACSQESPPQTSATTDPAFTKSDKAIPAPSTPETQIVTALVTVEPSHPVLSLAGKVSYGEDRYSKISSALVGRVQKIHGQLGDFVKAGELLVAIESPEIASAYSEFIKEHSDLSYAQRSYGLAKDLYEIKALPQKDLKQAENDYVKAKAEFRRARERLLALQVSKEELDKPIADQTITSTYQIRSPLSGTIVDRAVTPGQSVSGDPNQVLFTVADLNTVQVIADVYERDLGLVKIKQHAMVTVEAYPETAFPATISAIGDVVDQTTRTIKLRAVVNNSDRKLKPGMFARLNVKLSESLPYPLIPQEAVLEIDGNMYVYVADSDNHYIKRPIKTGLPSSGHMSVLHGLKAGETIVVKGAVLLKGQDMNVEEGGLSSEHTPPFSPDIMIGRLVELSLVQRALVCAFGLFLLFGGLYAFHILDVVAYPDPSPPFVEVISQKAGWSAEEMERIITIPIETALQGIPGLTNVRSLSLFGLSELKVYFEFGTNWYFVRQEVLNRLHAVDLPEGVKPELSPWWAIAEIYRYELVGDGYSLTDLKTIQDWQVRRAFKQVPGIIDVTAFGGTTKEYHVDLDPGALLTYGVTLAQIKAALANSNANVGGSYLALGPQSYNVRGVGFIESLDDVAKVVVAVKDGTPIFIENLGKVSIGTAIRLGQVGINEVEDTLEGVILLQRDTQALSTLERVNQKVEELNQKKLPPGVQIKTIYDRTTMINTVIETVVHILINGMVLVLLVLLFFLGHFRTALIVACTIPLALLFTFSAMVIMGQSANLISLGAIDFGIIVDAPLVMVESIFYYLCHHAKPGVTPPQLIARAARHVGRPILFSTVIIVVAFIPLFTMTGVPGKIFAPMSITYGLALAGSLLLACTLAPAMCSFLLNGPMREKEPKLVSMLRQSYLAALRWGLHHQKPVLGAVGMLLLVTVLALNFMGGEFMPALEEGNLWVRIRMPIDIRFEDAAALATRMRNMFMESPEVDTAVSQLGRPDDGTDPESFFNVEYYVNLKHRDEWRPGLTKEGLIEEIEGRLETIPGLKVNFSQLIQDSVEEAMSGVKSENSIKLYGHNLTELQTLAEKVEGELKNIRGVKELSINRTMGQPNLLIQVDRQACARYGIQVGDVNAMVQAAIGGEAVTEVIEGDRRFELVVRFLPQYRQDENTIGQIQVSSPEGVGIPLKQLAKIVRQTGAFMIYRENHERYIPIMFSIRDRDLVSTIQEAQRHLQEKIQLPEGYHLEWAGQYDQLVKEQQRLMIVVPLTMVLILFLLYLTFGSFRYAFIVLATVPFAMIGGVLSLVLTHTPFSISAAVGFISTLGIAILGGVLIVSSIRELEQNGIPLKEAILSGAEMQMRPVLMATLGAALGLVPAALASGIGSEAQKPLARVVVGGMLTATFLILFVVPILYHLTSRLSKSQIPQDPQLEDQEQDLNSDHVSLIK